MGESPDPPPTGLLEEWRELLLRYGDRGEGQESYASVRAGAEAAVARWVWAKAGSQLHRIEPFARERGELPEPELVAEPPMPAANLELYGYDAQGRIVWVRTHGDRGELRREEFLLHETDQITSIGFSDSNPPRRGSIRRWRLRGGRVQELVEGTERSMTVTRYGYAGERVERATEQRFEPASGERSDQVFTPTYAPDGRLLELRRRSTIYEPFWQRDSVVYRLPPEDLPDLPFQRETLARQLTEAIAGALIAARPPDRLYALVLAHQMSSLYVWPLFQVRRRYLLGAAEDGTPRVDEPADPSALWDAWSPEDPADYLPDGVDPAPYDRLVMSDAVQPFDDPELDRAFDTYRRTAAVVDRDEYGAVDALWREVAARLGGLDWEGLLDVTDDFVVLAYPFEPRDVDILEALRQVPPDRYREFDAKGWIPRGQEPGDRRGDLG
jgi:hypothetical protein